LMVLLFFFIPVCGVLVGCWSSVELIPILQFILLLIEIIIYDSAIKYH
jgi:hypothetical protein